MARRATPRRGAQHRRGKVYELRTYTAPEGKLPNLHARFRDHTLRIFKKHGMTNVVYWVPQDAPPKDNTLVYLLSHESREAAKKSWADFRPIPSGRRWPRSRRSTAAIVSKVESVFLDATDYSPMK